jgi:protein-S-isoprenylcysteine O-methyltransferase Ste14
LLILIGQFFFKHRNYVSPLVVLALVLAAPPRLGFGTRRGDLALVLSGVALTLVGQVLRVAVIGYAYIKRGGKDKQVYAQSLVQEGFFAHCRNPLYVGNLLVMFGVFVVYNSPWVYAVGIPFFLFLYITIVMAEEDYLVRRFGGEYQSYCRRVNRFIPGLRGLGKSLEGMSFDWQRVIRKEYGTIFANVATLIIVLAWKQHRLTGKASIPLMLSIIPAILAYAAARYAKKTDRLGTD